MPLVPDASFASLSVGLTKEEARLASTRKMKPPKEKMDWEAFWALPRPTVSDEAAREAIEWAKGDR
jgi:hypothetical protein